MTGSFAAVTGSSPGNTASFPALTGSFPALTQSFPALTGSFSTLESGDDDPNAGPGLKNVFKLPRKLPGVRLPSDDRLAAQARSAPIMGMLEALARWLGSDGRLVGAGDELSDTDAADAVRWLGIRPQYLTYLWDYALTTGWFELEDEPNRGRTWAVLGETAWRWADGDDSGALHVWAAVFAAVLTRTLDVAATEDLRASRRLKFQGQGVVTAITLFLARRAGKSGAEIRDLMMSGAIGDRPSSRARRAWDGWVRGHGDPARWLLSELAALRAIGPPSGDDGIIELTPLALWALREQLRRDGVEISLLKASSAQMTAAALAIFADGLTDAEVETEFNAWLAARGADRGAHELLVFAAFSGPQLRLAAVNLVRRIGPAAHLAWLDSMHRPELRGYARIALAGMTADLPESTLSTGPRPGPRGPRPGGHRPARARVRREVPGPAGDRGAAQPGHSGRRGGVGVRPHVAQLAPGCRPGADGARPEPPGPADRQRGPAGGARRGAEPGATRPPCPGRRGPTLGRRLTCLNFFLTFWQMPAADRFGYGTICVHS